MRILQEALQLVVNVPHSNNIEMIKVKSGQRMFDTLQLVVNVPYTQLLKVGEICGSVRCSLPNAPLFG